MVSIIENILDPHVEQAGNPEGQGEGRVVFAGLDGVDRLTRHIEPASQFRLAPVAFGAQDFEAVFHGVSDLSAAAMSGRRGK